MHLTEDFLKSGVVRGLVEQGSASDRSIEDVIDIVAIGAARASCHVGTVTNLRLYRQEILT
jgi:hypothetical protein